MTNLEKLLVFVPIAQHDEFILNHVGKTAEQDPKYFNKIAFLSKTSEIVTHGQKYGLNGSTDITDIKNILINFGTEEGKKYTTVSAALDDVIAKLDGSNLINFTYTNGALTLEDTVSLTYTDGWLHLGGGTSYGTVLGNSIKIASTGADVADTAYTYVAATTSAIREYLSSELGDIANALTFEGGFSYLQSKLDGGSTSKKDVGNLYVMDSFGEDPETHQPITTYTITVGGTNYNLELGDNVIIKSVNTTAGTVTGVIVTERNLDGAVTTSSQTLNANKIVVGNGNQTIVTTTYGLGDDAKELTTTNAVATTLATEVEVANAIAKVSGSVADLNGGVTYTDNYLTYSYTQAAGLVKDVSISANIATVDSSTAIVTGTGLIDATAASNIITYVTTKIDNLDESFTTVDVASDSTSYLAVTYTVTGNDYTYSVGTNIVALGNAVGMQYDETTGQWVPASGVVNHGLLDAADVAAEIIADEQVVAAALNDHESRIDSLEAATGGISINGDANTLAVTYTGLTYTLTPTTATVTSDSAALVTGAQVYSHVSGAISALDVATYTVSATGSASVTGYIAFSYTETDGIVNISGLSYQAAYVSVADNLEASVDNDGLVTGQLLADVINALNPWEEYAGEPAQS